MATGVTNSERNGKQALLATHAHSDPYPLPPEGSQVNLVYTGKISKEEILNPISVDFVGFDECNTALNTNTIMQNAYVLADNFIALHAIKASNIHPKLIYLDPPYGTGLEFQTRGMEHAYADDLGLAQYIEYLRRRLILMHYILADDGSIYIHIGHQMLGHLKVLMDEIFGERNFRNIITRRKCSSKNFTKNQYANIHDYILFYSKSSNYIWNQPGICPDSEWIDKEYPKVDSKGRYKLVPIHAPGIRRGETGTPWRNKMPPTGKHWQYQPKKLDELDIAGEIHWSKTGNPRRKVYLPEDKMVFMTDYWDKFRDAHHQSIQITGYPTEKNLELLKLIVGASSNANDLVLDPFCGSGTTMHAANMLGRKWIGIDNSFKSAQTVMDRFKLGLRPMGDYVQPVIKAQQPLLLDYEDLNPNSLEKPAFKIYFDSFVYTNHKEEVDLLLKRKMTQE